VSGLNEIAKDSLKVLFSDVVSANRFRQWKTSDSGGAGLFSQYALGEIFWKKAIGRPSTALLRDGFSIDASYEVWVLLPVEGGAAWERLLTPCIASWWDGKNDNEYWRVPFMVGKIPSGRTLDNDPLHSLYTHITPSLQRNVPWTSGGRFGVGSLGIRTIEPHAAVFVKEEGAVNLSFEVVLKSPFTFDRDGVAAGP
jgi:hypothetical protein